MARLALKSNAFNRTWLSVACLSLITWTTANAQSPVVPPANPTSTPASSPTPAKPAASATPPAAPGALRPMKDILRDAKAIPGYFTLHQKDEKVWIEILPSQLGKPFFFSYNIPRSVGERGLYGSQMGGSKLVEFHKIGNLVQLIAKNTQFFAKEGTPQAQFVSESFSDSLMSSAAVVAAPHPETKSILIEANALLFSDIPGYQTRLEASNLSPNLYNPKSDLTPFCTKTTYLKISCSTTIAKKYKIIGFRFIEAPTKRLRRSNLPRKSEKRKK